MNSIPHPLNRIVRTSSSSTCNRNRFDSLPVVYTVRRTQYDRLSQQQLSFLFSSVMVISSVMCISCRRRRIDGTDRISSRDNRAMTSRKQVLGDESVLRNLTSSCCQGRRRTDAETRRRPVTTGRQLMSVWDSGTDSDPHHRVHQDRLRAFSPTVIVEDRLDDVYCHHHHHHHEFCERHLQQDEQVSSTDGQQGSNTPIRSLSVRRHPFECQLHRLRPRIT